MITWSDSSIVATIDVVEAGDLELLIETSDGLAVDG